MFNVKNWLKLNLDTNYVILDVTFNIKLFYIFDNIFLLSIILYNSINCV